MYLVLKSLNRFIKNIKNKAQKKTIKYLNIFSEFLKEFKVFINNKNNPVTTQNRTNPEGALYSKKKNPKNKIKNGATFEITIFLLDIINGINMEKAAKQSSKTGKRLKPFAPIFIN
jgi:hypothetical protein